MRNPRLALIVIKSENIEKMKEFYGKIGLAFRQEKHGEGPVHYSTSLNGIILEIYPVRSGGIPDKTRLGFFVDLLEERLKLLIENGAVLVSPTKKTECFRITAVIKDPEGRSIELHQKTSFC